MRTLALLFLLGASSCSLAVDTDNLAGGTRDAAAAGDTAGSDGAVPDTSTCNPDDCEGDDAVVVKLADIAPCSSETTDKLGCRKKVSDACRAKDPCCFTGGYGPVAFPNATEATIICLSEPTYDAPLSEILAAAPGCASSALASRACDNAVHVSAKTRGQGSGVLQHATGDTATVIGLELAEETDINWSDLTSINPGCTAANVEKQACTSAVQTYCTTGDFEGYVIGNGPIKWTSSSVTVVCN
jgi:hypothetical protein